LTVWSHCHSPSAVAGGGPRRKETVTETLYFPFSFVSFLRIGCRINSIEVVWAH
jgi:hypothetical protein